jgi:porin
MSAQTGSLWLTLRGWTDYDHFALTEFFWHQGTIDSPFEYRIGRVKNTTIWNGGKFIGGSTKFNGGQITGTPAMANMGAGWSATVVYHPSGNTSHVMAGVYQGNGDNETFEPLRSDELVYAFQAGLRPEFNGHKGRYHIFAWHVDETESTSEANGFALNAEHTFDNWTPFFRYSFGDQDRSDPKSPPIRQSANLGIGYEGVFGQNRDWVAIVATWAEPTDNSLRNQYGFEADYSVRLTPHIIFTPHFQLIRNPSNNPSTDHLTVIGLRARVEF